MTGNAVVGIPAILFIALDNTLRLAVARRLMPDIISASLVSSLLTSPGIERSVEFVLDRIPNMGTRTVSVTGRVTNLHRGLSEETIRNSLLHQNQWNQLVNQYANNHFDPERPNHVIELPAYTYTGDVVNRWHQ